MNTRRVIRACLLLAVLCAVAVTWRVNALNRALDQPITKNQLEALITAGGGQVMPLAKASSSVWIQVVKYSVPGCGQPIYMQAGSISNNIFYYLRSNRNVNGDAYDNVLAYADYFGPPLHYLTLRFRWLRSDISYFFGQPPQPNAGQALFFLVPQGCSAQGNIDWQSLWRGSGSAAVLTQP